ncbi:Uncharacterised protein [uncultured archaeon]|nr:Uncharacterised protein [uncultured archaeon]
MIKRLFFFFWISLLLLISFVNAFSYTISDPVLDTSNPYQGEDAVLTSTVTTASDNMCTITCSWKTNNYDGIVGNPEPLAAGQSKTFPLKIRVQGNSGQALDTLSVTCVKYSGCMWGSADSIPQKSISFRFNYNGDGSCQTDKKEECYSASSDCICSSGKKCREDLTRSQDSMGCTTYCGNGLIEKESETCSNCPKDVGKCDGISCIAGSECEGKYCVHENCWNNPYKLGDGFCDLDKGENCKNSVNDCTCKSNEKCSSTGICETYCGNGICENSEVGSCKLDCKWCGDGECSNNEECSSCSQDCGVCDNTKIKEDISKTTQETINQGLSESTKRQKIIIYSTLGIITLFVTGYVSLKFVKHKKGMKKELDEKSLGNINHKKSHKAK